MLLMLTSKLVSFIDSTASYRFTLLETFLYQKDDWHCLGAFKAGNVLVPFFCFLSLSFSLTVWERNTLYVNPWWRRYIYIVPEMSDISCTSTCCLRRPLYTHCRHEGFKSRINVITLEIPRKDFDTRYSSCIRHNKVV
jgi:hypothetical protein